MRRGRGRSFRFSALWVRLTAASTFVTLIVLSLSFALSYLSLRIRLQGYIEGRYGSVPSIISKQLATYYQQRSSWEGVELLLEDDFPLGLVETTLADADGTVVYASCGEGVGDLLGSDERGRMVPVTLEGQTVGYWRLNLPASLAPESPEWFLLENLERLLILGAVLAIGAGLVISGVLARSLTIPLHRLVAASQAVAGGDLNQQVEEKGSDEVVQMALAFNEMTAALKKAEELRQNLMADVAHELRTPLSVVQGNLRAILDDVYPMDKAEIAHLYDETRLLSRLVNDLGELARAEAGQLSLNRRTMDVGDLCRTTVANFEPASDSKEIELSCDLPPSLPRIEADPDRLAQVLRNLLANALRHTPRGGRIAVTAGLEAGRVRITVADNGRGIPTEHLEHVFDRFWRVDPARSRENGGSGLGLAIAKSLVEAHGGRIWAESRAGQGATFIFEVPVKPVPQGTLA